MSDFRDYRDPNLPYGYDRDAVRRMQAEAMGTAWGYGPIIGLLLLLGVMFFAFSSGDYPRVATNDTPVATEPSTTPTPAPTPPASN